jgi:hypothetical protein
MSQYRNLLKLQSNFRPNKSGKVRVRKADKWPYGKPMSAAGLIRYVAGHVA